MTIAQASLPRQLEIGETHMFVLICMQVAPQDPLFRCALFMVKFVLC